MAVPPPRLCPVITRRYVGCSRSSRCRSGPIFCSTLCALLAMPSWACGGATRRGVRQQSIAEACVQSTAHDVTWDSPEYGSIRWALGTVRGRAQGGVRGFSLGPKTRGGSKRSGVNVRGLGISECCMKFRAF